MDVDRIRIRCRQAFNQETYAMQDSYFGLGILHPSFMVEAELSIRVQGQKPHIQGFWVQAELWNAEVREKNGTVPCRKPKILDVEQLTLNTNSNVLN